MCLRCVVRHERLQLADGDRRLLLERIRPDREADDALALAEALLRAQPSAHLRQVAGLAEDVRGAHGVAHFEQLERARDVVVHRARLLARRVGHWMQRAASSFAVSRSKPRKVSSQFLIRIFGFCLGIG